MRSASGIVLRPETEETLKRILREPFASTSRTLRRAAASSAPVPRRSGLRQDARRRRACWRDGPATDGGAFGALFSRFLGATAVRLRAIFAEMPRRPGVYLFDEFDSVAKARGDSQDVGEMNRVVTAFLQLVDADMSGSVLVAATNHVELLDRAVFRRFDVIVPFDKPTSAQIAELMKLRLSTVGLTEKISSQLAAHAEGWSFADVARACDDAVRTMALDDREEVWERDVVHALEQLKRRNVPARS